MKRLRDEKDEHGRAYHEFREEAYNSRWEFREFPGSSGGFWGLRSWGWRAWIAPEALQSSRNEGIPSGFGIFLGIWNLQKAGSQGVGEPGSLPGAGIAPESPKIGEFPWILGFPGRLGAPKTIPRDFGIPWKFLPPGFGISPPEFRIFPPSHRSKSPPPPEEEPPEGEEDETLVILDTCTGVPGICGNFRGFLG